MKELMTDNWYTELDIVETASAIHFSWKKAKESQKLKERPAMAEITKGNFIKQWHAHRSGIFGEAIAAKVLVGELLPFELWQMNTGKSDCLGYEVKGAHKYASNPQHWPPFYVKPPRGSGARWEESDDPIICVYWDWLKRDTTIHGQLMGWCWAKELPSMLVPNEKGNYEVPCSMLYAMDTLPITDEYFEWMKKNREKIATLLSS